MVSSIITHISSNIRNMVNNIYDVTIDYRHRAPHTTDNDYIILP